MSCGCGGRAAMPAGVTLRIQAVQLSQSPDSRLTAEQAYVFITSGIDVKGLDAPAVPMATGESPGAVASRNALINAPLTRVHGLPKGADLAAAAGIGALGVLIQMSCDACAGKIGTAHTVELDEGLGRYGLKVGMTTDEIRDWILTGPA